MIVITTMAITIIIIITTMAIISNLIVIIISSNTAITTIVKNTIKTTAMDAMETRTMTTTITIANTAITGGVIPHKTNVNTRKEATIIAIQTQKTTSGE